MRIALVIGNSAYAGPAALPNPVNDAKAMGAYVDNASKLKTKGSAE